MPVRVPAALLALALLALAGPPSTGAEVLLAGAGEAEFRLPEGVSLAGYGGGERRRSPVSLRRHPYAHRFKASRGILDPVGSRALVLGWGERRIALVSTDLVAVSNAMRQALLARVAPLGIGGDDLLLAATHTHSGPSGFARPKIWQFVAADKFVPELFDRYVDSMAESVERATARLEPARLALATARIEGVTKNRREQPEMLDPVATVVRIDAADGRPLATLLDFPIHPTVLTERNLLLSGDVAGAIVRRLEDLTGAAAIFFNGAEGDVAPTPPSRDPAGVEALGREIAAAVAALREELAPVTPAKLETARVERPIGRPQLNLGPCAGWQRKSGKWMKKLKSPYLSTAAPVSGLRIDDHVFVALPGEPIVEIGRAIRERARALGFAGTSVLGLTDDYVGYVLTEEQYLAGGYEACASWYGRRLGATLLDGADEVLAALSD